MYELSFSMTGLTSWPTVIAKRGNSEAAAIQAELCSKLRRVRLGGLHAACLRINLLNSLFTDATPN
jgi:hypothetical protein